MKSNTKEEREAEKKAIVGEAAEEELQQAAKDCGKLWLILSLLNRFSSVLLKLPYNYVDNRQFQS